MPTLNNKWQVSQLPSRRKLDWAGLCAVLNKRDRRSFTTFRTQVFNPFEVSKGTLFYPSLMTHDEGTRRDKSTSRIRSNGRILAMWQADLRSCGSLQQRQDSVRRIGADAFTLTCGPAAGHLMCRPLTKAVAQHLTGRRHPSYFRNEGYAKTSIIPHRALDPREDFVNFIDCRKFCC